MSATLAPPALDEDEPRGWFLPKRGGLPEGTVAAAMEAAFPEESKWAKDPVGWVKARLGEWLWSKQREVAESVRDNRYTAVPSAHQTGKSFIASRLACWWLESHPVGEAFVVTSAPTAAQVSSILWREIGKAHRKAGLSGKILGGAVPSWKIGEEIVAFGRKPADKVEPEEAMQAFQGIHAKYVLVILDEAGGIPKWLFDAADSLVGNDYSRVLAIGNPDNPASHFREICRPGSGWKVIRISALMTPNFTGEWVPEALRYLLVGKTWVRERIKRWGKKSPIFISKVLGRFPRVGTDTLIHPEWIEQAQHRDLSGNAILVAGRYGCDIADTGNDETVFYLNRAGFIRIAETIEGEECAWHGQGLMETVGQLNRLLVEKDRRETSAVVDSIGVGAGVVSRALELSLPIMPFNAANKPHRPDKYKNRRSEQWWAVRQLFDDGLVDIDPDDDELAAQLGAIKWHTDSTGRIQVEKKEDMKKRLDTSSPDRADAFMMSTVPFDHLPPLDERQDYDPRQHQDEELSAGILDAEL